MQWQTGDIEEKRATNSCIVFSSDKKVHLQVHLFDDFSGYGMMRLVKVLENSLYVLLVLVNFRPANGDSMMELSQSSMSTNYSRFPEACLKRRNSCPKYCGVLHLVLSKRKLSCNQLSYRFSFDLFLQRILLVKFVSALRTSKLSPWHFAQVVNEFDDSLSSISLCLFFRLLRWHCCRDKLFNHHCRENVSSFCSSVCTPRTISNPASAIEF